MELVRACPVPVDQQHQVDLRSYLQWIIYELKIFWYQIEELLESKLQCLEYQVFPINIFWTSFTTGE